MSCFTILFKGGGYDDGDDNGEDGGDGDLLLSVGRCNPATLLLLSLVIKSIETMAALRDTVGLRIARSP